ncbi:MAG TPA: sensor histidine kinase [Gemmataceae bacterium]|jgi:signal transduction histidine kinase|nr:sensor histidine kinase [Gemmataceae bacterium]
MAKNKQSTSKNKAPGNQARFAGPKGTNASLLDQVRKGRERSQRLAQQLLQAQEMERRRLARELHDEIGQALTAVKLNLEALDSRLPAKHSKALDESLAIVDTALQQVRGLSLDLRPAILDDLGLASALRWYVDRQAQRGGIAMEFTNETPGARSSVLLETTCFRVAQEALTNVLRHAKAHRVSVLIRQNADAINLYIEDDGIGFDTEQARQMAVGGACLGLLSMQERVILAGGRLDVTSTPGRGTTIHVCLPLGGQPVLERRSQRRKTR